MGYVAAAAVAALGWRVHVRIPLLGGAPRQMRTFARTSSRRSS